MSENMKAMNLKVYQALLLVEEAYKQHAEELKKFPARKELDTKLYCAMTDMMDFLGFDGFAEMHDPDEVAKEVLGVM